MCSLGTVVVICRRSLTRRHGICARWALAAMDVSGCFGVCRQPAGGTGSGHGVHRYPPSSFPLSVCPPPHRSQITYHYLSCCAGGCSLDLTLSLNVYPQITQSGARRPARYISTGTYSECLRRQPQPKINIIRRGAKSSTLAWLVHKHALSYLDCVRIRQYTNHYQTISSSSGYRKGRMSEKGACGDSGCRCRSIQSFSTTSPPTRR